MVWHKYFACEKYSRRQDDKEHYVHKMLQEKYSIKYLNMSSMCFSIIYHSSLHANSSSDISVLYTPNISIHQKNTNSIAHIWCA